VIREEKRRESARLAYGLLYQAAGTRPKACPQEKRGRRATTAKGTARESAPLPLFLFPGGPKDLVVKRLPDHSEGLSLSLSVARGDGAIVFAC
jgi:hypothetical protein